MIEDHTDTCPHALWLASPQHVGKPPACDCDALLPLLHDAAVELREAEMPSLADAAALAHALLQDARTLADGFARSPLTLCLCGEGRSCDCGGDLARSILRRMDDPPWRGREP